MRPLTARARLSLLLTALVLTAGAALAALTYLLMRQRLRHASVFTQLDPDGSTPPAASLRELADRLVQDTLSTLVIQAALALIVVTALAAALGWLVAGRVLRPIRAISSTARRLSAENLAERVPVTAPADELAVLATTVNDMLDRIQRGVAERDRIVTSQRLFTANAAHELRTPLTTARTAIDVTLDGRPSRAELLGMAMDVRAAVGHVQRVLDGLLLLARSQSGIGATEPADLAAIAAGALAASHDRARGLMIKGHLQPALVSGEPILLERMIGNLVDNAIRYNCPAGKLTVTTATVDGRAVLRIANTGREIPPDEAQTLLEPFVRSHGLGLGLSIVRAVALAHHGRIEVTARPGGGLDITVDLPATPTETPAKGVTTPRPRPEPTPGETPAKQVTTPPPRPEPTPRETPAKQATTPPPHPKPTPRETPAKQATTPRLRPEPQRTGTRPAQQ